MMLLRLIITLITTLKHPLILVSITIFGYHVGWLLPNPGGIHHGPPPSGGPATAGPGSANNQLRYNMGYYYIWVSRGLPMAKV